MVAIATAGYGAVAVTASPAQAQSISSGAGPVTLSWPGGDLVASVDVPGVTPDVMSSDINTAWPEFVGLSPDPSPSALIQATWQHFEANAPTGQDPQPSSFAGGSLSATSDGNGGSTVTLDIPAGDFQANTLPAWLAGALAAAAGVVATVAAIGICTVGFLRVGGPALRALDPNGTLALTTLGLGICAGIGAALGTFITAVVNQWLTGAPFDSDFWQNTASQALVQGLGAAASVWLAGIVVFGLSYAMAGIANTVTTLISFIKPFVSASTWQSIAAGVERFFSRGWQEIETELGNIARRAGFPAPRSSGQVHTPPASTAPANPGTPAAANCIDAYGTDGTNASPGQSVAVNTCNGNAAQNWDYYPNGNIVISGMCVDTQGGTSSIGTPLVDLEPCDGSSSQVWTQSGTALVNGATSDCLDDPNDNTTPGIQLDSYPCNNSAAQQWVTANPQTCDIYASYGTACVAAYSMTRALYAAYDGPLYEVQRASDSATDSIGLLNTGGYVDAAAQDSFCANTTCTITEIYDQSPLGNNLTIEGSGGNGGQDRGAVANALPIKVNGNEAYGLDVESGVGYRDDATIGVATDGAPEGMYMVASGTHVNSGCCFDFGNAEANNDDNGAGHMDAVNLSTTCYGPNGHCTGSGPWVQADMENGLFMGSSYTNTANLGNNTPFVTAMLGNDGQSSFQLNGGDATTGSLSTWYNGPLPSGGYAPMSQEGAVLLGTGGDDSNGDVGSWFEGVMTSGDPSQAADNAVQANIVSAGYSGSTNPSGGTGTGSTNGVTPSAAGPAVVHSAGATGAAASGFSSVYTVDSANGHLQETYLPYMGDNWTTQDLTANYGTPPVMPGTKPVALVHCGYTSVYTVDAGSGDLQETYLPAIGDNWSTQDLSAKYGTPPTDVTPTALVHDAGATGSAAACGFTSVYTVDRGSYDLQETYLPVIGDAWTTQNLSANYGTPAVQEGTSPVAIVHCGYTSVYTVDQNHQLQETYLPAIGDPWSTQSLSANYGTPDTTTTPTAVVHGAGATGSAAACGFTSVYTVDQGSDDLQETYLPVIGGPWTSQNLSGNYGTPAVAPGTAPVALVHMNFTSVYTVDQGSDQLQETYLPAIGDSWTTQSLSANYGTPTTDQTPIVLLHPDASGNLDWTSVYTIDEFSDHLQETYLPNAGFPGDPWVTQDLTAKYGSPEVAAADDPTADASVVHSGYTSVYSVDSSGNLWETYLPAMGDSWSAQDLSAKYGTPKVMNGTAPVAITHDGYTSVYTIDQGGDGVSAGDLQETYLPAIGDSWSTQDLSSQFGTPASDTTPTALFHDGYTSVYSVQDATTSAGAAGDLWETYLPAAGFPGDPWHSQNLSQNYGTPIVDAFTSPTAILHDGYVSVYTVDASTSDSALGDLQETYLPAIGDPWITQNLSVKYGTPLVNILTSPAAVVHNGYVSVYTVDADGNNVEQGDLQETYLPAIGDSWSTQDLSANYHTPQVEGGEPPVPLTHTGFTSVYTVDAGGSGTSQGDLQETYLPAIGDPWTTQDLSSEYKTPATDDVLTPLLHYDTSGGLTWTSVYTFDSGSGDLQETYLPSTGFPGDPWVTQNLTSLYGAPAL